MDVIIKKEPWEPASFLRHPDTKSKGKVVDTSNQAISIYLSGVARTPVSALKRVMYPAILVHDEDFHGL